MRVVLMLTNVRTDNEWERHDCTLNQNENLRTWGHGCLFYRIGTWESQQQEDGSYGPSPVYELQGFPSLLVV
jgi:hypothetical protein